MGPPRSKAPKIKLIPVIHTPSTRAPLFIHRAVEHRVGKFFAAYQIQLSQFRDSGFLTKLLPLTAPEGGSSSFFFLLGNDNKIVAV